ncbi:MAG: cytochrome ubiquinol oxidase subunit I [Nitrospinota bacterium]|nr:cytochrome ubiquinol oxidase subunit I [Nitrospinota bacterium]
MPSSNVSEQKPFSFKLVLLALFAYSLVHLSPALPGASTSSFIQNLMGPQSVLAQDDEDEEDEEEGGDEEGGGEETGGEAAEGDEAAAEEDENAYLYDIGPAKDIKPTKELKDGGGYTFPGLGNRKATWGAAQLHILFASFILGCPMFVVIMEVMGARRTQGVRKAIILANVFMGVLTGVIIGIIGEIIVNIHHGVLYGMWACAFAALIVSFLNYFHLCMNTKISCIVGGVVGAFFAYLLVPTDHTTVQAIALAVLNGAVGGFLSTAIMFAEADYKFERLAHEITKVIGFCYSFTALTGGLFLFIMMVAYKDFISYLVTAYPILFMIGYPTLFILETIVLYIYVYSWDPLNKTNKKGRHIVLGVILNILGLSLLCALDGPATFMQTPPKPYDALFTTMTEWDRIATMTWMPLNYHRLVGNGTFGGFMVGVISAYMYLWSKDPKEKEYYDWVGYMGNFIGVLFMIPLPAMGYIFVREIYQYDATIGMYIMSDRESMFMLVQGLLIGTMFTASNIYMWVSMKRIENAHRFFPAMKLGFILIVIAATIWFTPRRFFATMMPEPGMNPDMVLPDNLAFLALMISKNTAAFALVTVTLINYIFYTISTRTGKIGWGKINPLGPYILIFMGFTDIWLMSWMGTIRELSRMNWHIYKVFKDVTPEKYAPTLAESGVFVTGVVWTFFIIMTAIIWLGIKYPKTKKTKTEDAPAAAPQMAE